MIWSDMIWFNLIWFDMIWFDMICYDLLWFDIVWYEMIWYDMIWYDLIRYDLIWFDLIWYDLIWYDMTWFHLIWLWQDLHLRYPGTHSSGVGLLRSMLRFDPNERLSVDAALAHPYLASVRCSLQNVYQIIWILDIVMIAMWYDMIHCGVW